MNLSRSVNSRTSVASASAVSNSRRNAAAAFREYTAKFTPSVEGVAPSGYGAPPSMTFFVSCVSGFDIRPPSARTAERHSLPSGVARARRALGLAAGVPDVLDPLQAVGGEPAEQPQPRHTAVGVNVEPRLGDGPVVVDQEAVPGVGLQLRGRQQLEPATRAVAPGQASPARRVADEVGRVELRRGDNALTRQMHLHPVLPGVAPP